MKHIGFFLSLLGLLGLLLPQTLYAQPSTTYWFEGYVYGNATDKAEQRAAYLPVVLALASAPKNYVAITVTDGAGFFSFRGTQIDINKQYILTLLYGGARNENYKCLRFDAAPSLKGAVASDIKTRVRSDFYTTTAIPLAKQKGTTALKTVLGKNPALQLKAGVYYLKGKKGLPAIFVNGKRYYDKEFLTLLEGLTVEQVASARILRFKVANKFVPGVLDIKLKQGESVPLNTSRKFVPLPKK